MTKKTILITALLLAMIFVFVGCAGESFKFQALTVETMAGDLTSNGGVSVSYKGYTYFINGNVATYSVDNTFGDVTYGAVCRVKTATLKTDAFVDRDLANDEYSEVEVLAPKAVYTTATNCPNGNGLFIFNDRLYYTTPSTTKDREGAVQNTYLDIMSVALDGTDTQREFVVPGNSFDMMLTQQGENVYALYLNSEVLYEVNLSEATPTAKEVEEHITAINYDVEMGVAVFTISKAEEGHEGHDHEPTNNVIKYYKAGTEEATLLVDGKGSDVSLDVVMTIVEFTGKNVYFTVENDNAGRNGLYRVALTESDVVFENDAISHKVHGENLLKTGMVITEGEEENIVFYNEKTKYVQYVTIANKNAKNLFYTATTLTFLTRVEDKIFYVLSGEVKYFSFSERLSATNPDYAVEEDNVSICKYTNAVTWLEYDFYGDYMLTLATTPDSEVYLYYTDYNELESEDKIDYFVGIYVSTASVE